MNDKKLNDWELPEKAISALRQAAKKRNIWRTAMRDPVRFLAERQIDLPKGTELKLYEAAYDPKKLSIQESEFAVASSPISLRMLMPPIPLDSLGCPAGTLPIRTIEVRTTCVKFGIYRGPL